MKRNIIYISILLLSFIAIGRVIQISVIYQDKYKEKYEEIVNRKVTGNSAPRGRILDVNGKVLVDNVGVNTVIFNNTSDITRKDKIDVSLALASILTVQESKITSTRLKEFYILLKGGCDDLITEEEYSLYEKRRLSSEDIKSLKISRITEEMLATLSEEEKKASYIYYLISNGYSYQDKIIASNISDEELALINSYNLPGIRTVLTWERIYPYGDVLKSIFGSVSKGIPLELKDYYLDKGLSLGSTVGVSYLEYQYDEYLRGKDAIYKINPDNTLTLLEEEVQGNDLYLSIDIDVQLELESILKTEMLNAKKAKNTEYYNHSYVLIGNPKTGEIVAMSGLLLNGDHFVDITNLSISSSYTVGSIVKGATISVGYANDLIERGQYVTDSCIKVYGVTEKCSWKKLGKINDITALAYSSNYFQFLIATRLSNPKYTWNAHLYATEEHFKIYRDMLSSYGLGTMTGIDLPNENVGIIGGTVSDDLLLNLAIGQYDTYTPIEIFQYINTIANDGIKLTPHLASKIVSENKIIKTIEPQILGKVPLSEEDMGRVQEGMRQVMLIGTGRNYTDKSVTSAGKTGTSETFVDTNGDGKMDTKTISNAFIMYAPFENPEYTITIISPNISRSDGSSSYKYSINLRVNKKILKYLFEKP